MGQSYKFDRKLTHEEIEELLENFDYDTWLAEFDEDAEPEPNYDRFGNPTKDTLAGMYEDRHGLGESMTLDEFHEWLVEVCAEVDAEMEAEKNNEIHRNAQRIPA